MKLLIQWWIHDNNHKLSINPHKIGGVLLGKEGLKKSRAYLFTSCNNKSNFAIYANNYDNNYANNFKDMLFHVNERS